MSDRLMVMMVIGAVLTAAYFYRLGFRHGIEDGWWTCAAEYGVVG